MKSYQEFFAELKRRKVFRVAGIYGIVSFGVLQAADLALPRLGLPDWTVTFMLAVLLLFFPVALILAWAFEVTPDGVALTEPPAPGEIEAIVAEPAAKRWPAGILALLGVVALLGSGWWIGQRTASGPAISTRADSVTLLEGGDLADDFDDDERAAIAVLPFADMSAEGDQQYFGDGMAEEIINTLVKIRDLRVAGRTSAFAYKGQNKDLREIGTELGVAYLVEGSVRKEDGDLRITAQLIDASDGSHLWSESFDRPLANVFQIQREIAEAIGEELKVPLGLDDAELVGPTADLEAYDLYLAGRARIRERGVALREAIRLFEAAIARDSSWAPAWAGLAEATELIGWYDAAWNRNPDDRDERREVQHGYWTQSERAARRALDLDPNSASAHVALGSVLRNRYQWDEAEAAYRRALRTDPDSPEAHQQYGTMLLMMGRIREGRRATERAARLDRTAIRVLWWSVGPSLDGQPEESIRILEAGVADFPDSPIQLRLYLLRAYLAAGRTADFAALIADSENEREAITVALDRGDYSVLPESLRERPRVWMLVGVVDSALAKAPAFAEQDVTTHVWFWAPEMDAIRNTPEMQEVLRRFNVAGRQPDRTPRNGTAAP